MSSNEIIQVQHPAGHTAAVALQGATVISWKVKGEEEKLFVSSKAGLNGPAAIRGGIPVCFPIFGPPPKEAAFEKLKQHGFARISKWSVESPSKTNDDGSVSLVLSLVSTPEIKAVFEPDFALSYTVTLFKTGALETALKVINPSSSETLRFQSLLHTYLRLPEGVQPADTKIAGLGGLKYVDKPSGGGIHTQEQDEVVFEGETDRVYFDAPRDASLEKRDGTPIVQVQKANWADFTVWNPHKAKSDALGDMEADGWTRFVCIEPGHCKDFAEIAPGQTSISSQILVPA